LKFHKLLIFLFVIGVANFYAVNTLAQNNLIYFIRGQVVDKINEQPLPYCNVSLKGKSIGTLSNDSGFFEFKVKKEHLSDSLYVSALGYQSAYFLVNEVLKKEWFVVPY